MLQQIAENTWLGSGTAVNWLLVREGDALTLVDSGWPGDLGELEASVAQLGRRLGDIQAVLLTHAHVDHTGGLNALWERHRVPVLMHPDEVPLARGERREQASPADVLVRAWRPRVAVWSARIMRAGALSHPTMAHARAWDAVGPLDLPGAPVPVPCPGHTSGHTAYLFPSSGVLATGDALVTGHPVSGRNAPQLLPGFFHHDVDRARRALTSLAATDAGTIAPGHGYVWNGPVADAVRQALGG